MVIIIKNQSDLFERFISEPSDNRQLTYLPCVAVATTSYTAAPAARQVDVILRRQNTGPGVYFMSPGLL